MVTGRRRGGRGGGAIPLPILYTEVRGDMVLRGVSAPRGGGCIEIRGPRGRALGVVGSLPLARSAFALLTLRGATRALGAPRRECVRTGSFVSGAPPLVTEMTELRSPAKPDPVRTESAPSESCASDMMGGRTGQSVDVSGVSGEAESVLELE